MQIAREGAGTDAAHLRSFSPERRYATLVATVLDTATILIDETLEIHERFLGKLFNKAERKHLVSFQEQGKAINDKVRLYALVGQVLIEAKQSAADPFSEIEKLGTPSILNAPSTRFRNAAVLLTRNYLRTSPR